MAQPAAATTKTAMAGIYCQACGYDLRASGEAGRCPECGRVFSPADPKTFRTRPLGAWKRALARGARRAALLLLVLAVLLAGLWGWLYWGWRQEQAAAAQLGGTPVTWPSVYSPGTLVIPRGGSCFATPLGGAPGRWLCDHRVPGSFVLERIRHVVLPPTATDADLLPLGDLPRLEGLCVGGAITDSGLAALRACPRLQKITLYDNPRITDAGLVHLEKLPALQHLGLWRTRVTPAGRARLRAARPGCTVEDIVD